MTAFSDFSTGFANTSDSIRSSLSQLQQQILLVATEDATNRSEITRLTALAASLQSQLTAATAADALKAAEITRLSGLLTAANAEITRLAGLLTTANAEIARLRALIPPFATVSYLSDLTPITAINEWGPYQRDRSNGENGANDGLPITIRGTVYQKGLGVHASSVLAYRLGGFCDRFKAVIGIDDEVSAGTTPAPSVTFRVLTDGVESFASAVLTRTSTPVTVDIPVAGVQSLRLEVLPGTQTAFDHADWADARLSFATQAMLNQFLLLQGSSSGGGQVPAIGTVSVTGSGAYASGATVTLTASRAGTATDTAWSWAPPAGSGIANSNSNVLSFPMASNAAGTFTVTATSVAASDSPRTAQVAISLQAVTPPSGEADLSLIPMAFNSPIFTAMQATLNRSFVWTPGQAVTGASVRTTTEGSMLVMLGAGGEARRCRAICREGFRVGSGIQLIDQCYVEVNGTTTHADCLQAYNPGAEGTMTLQNSYFRVNRVGEGDAFGTAVATHMGNAAYWSANGINLHHVFRNVLVYGGSYPIKIPGDGGRSIDFKDVYIVSGSQGWAGHPVWMPAVNGARPEIRRWENVRYCTIVSGAIVMGDQIPRPY